MHSLACDASQQFKRKIRWADFVLKIEQPVVLRHSIPPTRHESYAVRRHELGECRRLYAVVADVVIARVVETAFDHVPDRFDNERRLKDRRVSSMRGSIRSASFRG